MNLTTKVELTFGQETTDVEVDPGRAQPPVLEAGKRLREAVAYPFPPVNTDSREDMDQAALSIAHELLPVLSGPTDASTEAISELVLKRIVPGLPVVDAEVRQKALDEYPCLQEMPSLLERHVVRVAQAGRTVAAHITESIQQEWNQTREKSDLALARIIGKILRYADTMRHLRKAVNGIQKDTLVTAERERNEEYMGVMGEMMGGVEMKELYSRQLSLWETITSNRTTVVPDVNYRQLVNGVPGTAHSLVMGVDQRIDRTVMGTEYGEFMEIPTAIRWRGFDTSFGFVHFVHSDDEGAMFQSEFPITMYDAQIVGMLGDEAREILSFDAEFPFTHDLWHHIQPVYARHFILHDALAPLSLGGFRQEYLGFAKAMRASKEEYETGLGIGHRMVMAEICRRDPAVKTKWKTSVEKALRRIAQRQPTLTNMYGNRGKDATDFLVCSVMGRAMQVFDPRDDEFYGESKAIIEGMELPPLQVGISEVFRLFTLQGMFSVPEAEQVDIGDTNRMRLMINQARVQPHAGAIPGADAIVGALEEIGILPFPEGVDDVELKGFNTARWFAMINPQRGQQRGFTEKIHRRDTVWYGGRQVSPFERVAMQERSLTQEGEVSEYRLRSAIRREMQVLSRDLFHFVQRSVQVEVGQAVDRMIESIHNLHFEALEQECALVSRHGGAKWAKRYGELCHRIKEWEGEKGTTILAERDKLLQEVMSLT